MEKEEKIQNPERSPSHVTLDHHHNIHHHSIESIHILPYSHYSIIIYKRLPRHHHDVFFGNSFDACVVIGRLVGCLCSGILGLILYFNTDVMTALTPSLPTESFRDAIVWITGAGSGLGEKLALTLSERSSVKMIILSSRNKEQLERVAAACRRTKTTNSALEIKILPLDLSDLESIPEKVKAARKLIDGDDQIDVLINAAGVSTRTFASDSSFDLDHYVAKVNYLGPACLIKSLFPTPPGTIIQLGSIAGKLGAPVRTAYSGSKAALHGWLEALYVESVLQGRQVYVLNCILGSVNTGLGDRALVDIQRNGNFVTFQQQDPNLTAAALPPDWVAERILAVAHAKKAFETWIALSTKELLPVLYFVTYFRHTAFLVLPKAVGRKYAVTRGTKKED
jgi:short-subunit dehydrogenase